MRMCAQNIFFVFIALIVAGCGSQNNSDQKDILQVDSIENSNKYDSIVPVSPPDTLSRRDIMDMVKNVKPYFNGAITDLDTISINGKRILKRKYVITSYKTSGEITSYSYSGKNINCGHNWESGVIIIDEPKKVSVISINDETAKRIVDNYSEILNVIEKSKKFPHPDYSSSGVFFDQRGCNWRSNFSKKFYKDGVYLANLDGGGFDFAMHHQFTAPTTEALDSLLARAPELMPPFVFFDWEQFYLNFMKVPNDYFWEPKYEDALNVD